MNEVIEVNGVNEVNEVNEVALVLASSSPRRRELLGLLGLNPVVVPADIDESVRPNEDPVAYVKRLAIEKAETVAARHPHAVIVGADTTVALGSALFAKPDDTADAVKMLGMLQGRDHVVHTGIAVVFEGHTAAGVETTRVWIRHLDDTMIRDYIATGEPMDKAGAYGIQGFGSVIVEKIEGDYFTVMGLGLGRVVGLMREVGVEYVFGRLARQSKE